MYWLFSPVFLLDWTILIIVNHNFNTFEQFKITVVDDNSLLTFYWDLKG